MVGTLLGQAVGLEDGEVRVDGEGCVVGADSSRQGPGQQLAAHPVQLADMAPPEAAQEGAQGGVSFSPETENAGGPAGAQRIGVVYAVAARQRGSDQGHHLVAGVGPAGGIDKVEVLLEELGQAQAQGEGGRKDQPGIDH